MDRLKNILLWTFNVILSGALGAISQPRYFVSGFFFGVCLTSLIQLILGTYYFCKEVINN